MIQNDLKFNSKFHFSPPYEREVWQYRKDNTKLSKLTFSKLNTNIFSIKPF